MELRVEHAISKQIGVDAPHWVAWHLGEHWVAWHLGEKVCAAAFALVRGLVFNVNVSVAPPSTKTFDEAYKLHA